MENCLEEYRSLKLEHESISRVLRSVIAYGHRMDEFTAAGDVPASKSCTLSSLVNRMEGERSRLSTVLRNVEERIRRIRDPIRREVLRRRFIEGDDVVKIAMDLSYSEATIWRANRSGCEEYRCMDMTEEVRR